MKCISVRQPWAWLIVIGFKPIENRTWSTKHRGPLAIHAGVAWSSEGEDFAERFGIICLREQLTLGAVVGVVDLVDIAPSSSKWAMPNCMHWHIANARTITPIPMKGRLGLFDVEIP